MISTLVKPMPSPQPLSYQLLQNRSNRHSRHFPVTHTVSGYACVTSHRTLLQQDRNIRIIFRARANGIDARSLSDADYQMRALMNGHELEEYERTKAWYTGGLDMPITKAAGIDLDGITSQDTLNRWAELDSSYWRKNDVIGHVLERAGVREMEIYGALTVGGVGEMVGAKGVHLFLKFGEMYLAVGGTMRVLSANPMDLVAVTRDGVIVESWSPCISIYPV